MFGDISLVVNRDKLTMPVAAAVASDVGIGQHDDGQGFGLEVALNVSLSGFSQTEAEELAKRGQIVCPYSHAIKGNVTVTTNIV